MPTLAQAPAVTPAPPAPTTATPAPASPFVDNQFGLSMLGLSRPAPAAAPPAPAPAQAPAEVSPWDALVQGIRGGIRAVVPPPPPGAPGAAPAAPPVDADRTKKAGEIVDGLVGTEGLANTDEGAMMDVLRKVRGDPALIAAVRAEFAAQKGTSLDDWLTAKLGTFDGEALAAEKDALLSGDRVAATDALLASADSMLGLGTRERDAIAKALVQLSPEERKKLSNSVLGLEIYEGDDRAMLDLLAGSQEHTVDTFAEVAAIAIDQEMDNVTDDDEDAAFAQAQSWLDTAWEAEKAKGPPIPADEEEARKQAFAEGFRTKVEQRYQERFGEGLYEQFEEGWIDREGSADARANVDREKMWYVLGGNKVGAQASDLERATRGVGTDDGAFWDAMIGDEANPLAALAWWEKKYAAEGESGTDVLGDVTTTGGRYGTRMTDLLAEYRTEGLAPERKQALEQEAKVVTAAMALDAAFGDGGDGTDEELARKALAGLTKAEIEQVALVRTMGSKQNLADATPKQREKAVAQLRAKVGDELGGRDGVRALADVDHGGQTGSVADAKAKESQIFEGTQGYGAWVDALSGLGADGNTPAERMAAIHQQATGLGAGDDARATALLTSQGAALDQASANEDAVVDGLATAMTVAATMGSAYLAPLLEGGWLHAAKAGLGGLADLGTKAVGGAALSDGSGVELDEVAEAVVNVAAEGAFGATSSDKWKAFAESAKGEMLKSAIGGVAETALAGGEDRLGVGGVLGVLLDGAESGLGGLAEGGRFEKLVTGGLAATKGLVTDGLSGGVSGLFEWAVDESWDEKVDARTPKAAASGASGTGSP